MSTAQDQPKIRVFISYSQHDPNHSKRVLEFAKALRKCGMDVELDQFHLTEILQWPEWCERQLRPEVSDFVLMICSEEYRRRIENRVPADQGRGVYWEGGIIYDYIYEEKANDRFIPILFDDEPNKSLPRKVSNWTWFRIRSFEIDSDKGYENLYRLLTKQPPVVKPELGPIRFLPQDDASPPSKAFAGDAATAEQRYALVIGINEYQHEQPGDEKSRSREFTDLDFAEQDATEFAKFLKDDQGYKVELLNNSKAGLKQIMEAMDRLRAKCKQAPNSLVLFFFSGHGWQDQEGRHYLVPHDGRKDEPFSTLLWSRLFDLSLGEVQTKRLVVFLDTCHAGGIGDVGVRGDAPPECNPETLLQELNKRYVVASCMAGQQSLEYKDHEHGIFTHHLLELLRLDTNDFDNCEEVDLWDLWSALKVKVKETAQAACMAIQEPWANFTEKKTGIILAINQRFKQRRKEREQRFLKALLESEPIRGRGDLPDLQYALESFIENSEQFGADDPAFFDCFRRGATQYTPDNTPKVQLIAKQLVNYWSAGAQQLSATSDKSASRGATSVQNFSAGRDKFARGAASIGIADASQGGTALTSPSTVPPALDEKRREVKKKLSEEDCDYVTEPLTSVVELRRLRGLLGDITGVSKEVFKSWAKNTKIDDAQLEEIDKRFNEKWNSAREQVTLKSALDLRTQ